MGFFLSALLLEQISYEQRSQYASWLKEMVHSRALAFLVLVIPGLRVENFPLLGICGHFEYIRFWDVIDYNKSHIVQEMQR